jgi:hypothetical protein
MMGQGLIARIVGGAFLPAARYAVTDDDDPIKSIRFRLGKEDITLDIYTIRYHGKWLDQSLGFGVNLNPSMFFLTYLKGVRQSIESPFYNIAFH